MTDQVPDLLSQVDWNFPDVTTRTSSIHALHWFPGNFIAQIPSYLVQALTTPGELVFDPFCGSGTTGIEAIRLGRNCIQADVNAASIQIASGKLDALNPHTGTDILQNLIERLTWPALIHSDQPGLEGEGTNSELCRWFTPDTLNELRAIWHLIEEVRGSGRDLLRLVFFDTLFDCASARGTATKSGGRRRHHWGWIADNVRPRQLVKVNAVERFVDRAIAAVDVIRRREAATGVSLGLFRHDARAMPLLDDSVAAIVTSPPYLGMIDYTRANRLHYLWENWNTKLGERQEIGARYRRDRPDVVPQYLNDMRAATSEMVRVLRPGGYCAVVIGASRKYPHVADEVVALLSDKFTPIWGPTAREATRRRVSDRAGSAPRELLIVCRKPK